MFLCACMNLHKENEDSKKQGRLRTYRLVKQRMINCWVYDKTKGLGLGQVPVTKKYMGKLMKVKGCFSRLVCISCVSSESPVIRMFSSSWCRRSLDPLLCRKEEDRKPFLHSWFLKYLLLKIINTPKWHQLVCSEGQRQAR